MNTPSSGGCKHSVRNIKLFHSEKVAHSAASCPNVQARVQNDAGSVVAMLAQLEQARVGCRLCASGRHSSFYKVDQRILSREKKAREGGRRYRGAPRCILCRSCFLCSSEALLRGRAFSSSVRASGPVFREECLRRGRHKSRSSTAPNRRLRYNSSSL